MATKFKTSQNAVPSKGEINNGKVITVPDQTVSMRTLIRRMENGVPATQSAKTPVYNEAYTLPDLHGLDLVDIQEIKMDLEQRITETKHQLNDYKNKITSIQAAKAAADKQAKEKPDQPDT